MTGSPAVVHEDDALQIVVWDRVVTSRWRSAPTKEGLVLLGRHQHALTESLADGRILALTIVGPRATMIISGEARKEAEALAKRGRTTLIALAQVVEGEGFIAATARAVISGVQLAARNPYPTKVFGRVGEACPWMEEQLLAAGYTAAAKGLREALEAGLGGRD